MNGRWWKAPELVFLDRRMQRLPAGLFRLWFNLSCVASWSGGRLPGLDDVAFLLRTSRKSLERRLEALRAAGLIEGDGDALRLIPIGGRSDNDPEASEPLTAAERTRRWRERQARDATVTACNEGRDAPVTQCDAQDKEREKETEKNIETRDAEIFFSDFIGAYPEREGGTAIEPARRAFRDAVAAGHDPTEIIAGAKAYAASMRDKDRKFLLSASRWLAERRWQGLAPKAASPAGAPGVWVENGTPEWSAWTAFRGKTAPIDARGGWRFPSRLPPASLDRAA